MMKKTTTVSQKSKRSTRTPTTVTKTVVTQQQSSKRSRRRRRGSSNKTDVSLAMQYANTMKDPFQYPAVRLGFGNLTISGIGTCYYRTTVSANPDGSFAVAAFPVVNAGRGTTNVNPILVNVSGTGNTTWNGYQWSNAAAFQNTAVQVRPVSIGVKVIPMVPATSASGILYAGAVTGYTFAQIAGFTPSVLGLNPVFKVGIGTEALATGRPVDADSFAFHAGALDAFNVNSDLFYSVPVVVGQGFPGSTQVFIECSFNFEYLSALASPFMETPLESPSSTLFETLAQKFTNVETMWSTIASWLPDPGTVNTLENMYHDGKAAAERASSVYRMFNPSLRPTLQSETPTTYRDGKLEESSSSHDTEGDSTPPVTPTSSVRSSSSTESKDRPKTAVTVHRKS